MPLPEPNYYKTRRNFSYFDSAPVRHRHRCREQLVQRCRRQAHGKHIHRRGRRQRKCIESVHRASRNRHSRRLHARGKPLITLQPIPHVLNEELVEIELQLPQVRAEIFHQGVTLCLSRLHTVQAVSLLEQLQPLRIVGRCLVPGVFLAVLHHAGMTLHHVVRRHDASLQLLADEAAEAQREDLPAGAHCGDLQAALLVVGLRSVDSLRSGGLDDAVGVHIRKENVETARRTACVWSNEWGDGLEGPFNAWVDGRLEVGSGKELVRRQLVHRRSVRSAERERTLRFVGDQIRWHCVGDLRGHSRIQTAAALPFTHLCPSFEVFSQVVHAILPLCEVLAAETATRPDAGCLALPQVHGVDHFATVDKSQVLSKMIFTEEGPGQETLLLAAIVIVRLQMLVCGIELAAVNALPLTRRGYGDDGTNRGTNPFF